MSGLVRITVVGCLLCGSLSAHATPGVEVKPWEGHWTDQGPKPLHAGNTGFSGQVSAIAVDLKNDPSGNTLYVGTDSGGLWKSKNGLSSDATFEFIGDPDQPLSIGSLALDTSQNPSIIYVATGDPADPFAASCHTGEGILVSKDGGKNWKRVGGADSGAHPFKGLAFTKVIADPAKPGVVLAAAADCMEEVIVNPGRIYVSARGTGLNTSPHLGIYRSADFGKTWKRVYAAASPATIDIVYQPKWGVYLAAVKGKGFFRSKDHGETWLQLTPSAPGWPLDTEVNQVSFATRGGTVWTLINANDCVGTGPTARCGWRLKLFQSTDDTLTKWEPVPEPIFPYENPNDPNTEEWFKAWGFLGYLGAPPNSNGLVIGHLYPHFTKDVSKLNDNTRHCTGTDATGCWKTLVGTHVDQHAVAFVNDKTWYIGNDGGIWSTQDSGQTLTDMNKTLPTTEVFSADSDGSKRFSAGFNDNGSAYGVNGDWQHLLGGDGLFNQYDGHQGFFIEGNQGEIHRLFNCTESGCDDKIVLCPKLPNSGCLKSGAVITPQALRGDEFFVPYEVLPWNAQLFSGNENTNSAILFVGLESLVLVASSHDPSKPPIGFDTGGGPEKSSNEIINFIAPVPGDPSTAYITTEKHGGKAGGLYRISNISFADSAKTTTLTNDSSGSGPIGSRLGHLAVSSGDPDTLYVIKVGFHEGAHLYKYTKGNWTNITGNLPNVAHYWVTVDPLNPNWIYVGTNYGVYMTTDGGTASSKWRKVGQGLPKVPVMQVRISPDRRLVAATNGRGVWTMPLPGEFITLYANFFAPRVQSQCAHHALNARQIRERAQEASAACQAAGFKSELCNAIAGLPSTVADAGHVQFISACSQATVPLEHILNPVLFSKCPGKRKDQCSD